MTNPCDEIFFILFGFYYHVGNAQCWEIGLFTQTFESNVGDVV